VKKGVLRLSSVSICVENEVFDVTGNVGGMREATVGRRVYVQARGRILDISHLCGWRGDETVDEMINLFLRVFR
jgi:hypothetical protein